MTTASPTASLSTAATTRTLYVLGHRVTVLPTPGDAAILDIETAPGVPGPPPHFHEDVDEFFYVVEGCLEVMIDGEWILLDGGEAFTVPIGKVHTFRNPSDRPTRWLTAFNPRNFERFFLDFGVPVERPDAQAASVADDLIARVVARCSDYGMILATD